MKNSSPGTAAIALAVLAACGDGVQAPAKVDPASAIAEKRRDLVDMTLPPLDLAEEPPEVDGAGLETVVVRAGEGAPIRYGEIGRFHAIGSLADGEVFQNTYEGEPEVLRVRHPDVMKGLALGISGAAGAEGTEGMKPGERRRITVPPELGPGPQGDYTKNIPANALVVYDVEYLGPVGNLVVGVMEAGTGKVLEVGMRGRFHYTGVLAKDGTVFDTTREGENPEPGEFVLRASDPVTGEAGVIRGWVLGLSGMREGGQRRLYIPADLAYGEEGSPPTIGAGEDLVFEVELVSVVE